MGWYRDGSDGPLGGIHMGLEVVEKCDMSRRYDSCCFKWRHDRTERWFMKTNLNHRSVLEIARWSFSLIQNISHVQNMRIMMIFCILTYLCIEKREEDTIVIYLFWNIKIYAFVLTLLKIHDLKLVKIINKLIQVNQVTCLLDNYTILSNTAPSDKNILKSCWFAEKIWVTKHL